MANCRYGGSVQIARDLKEAGVDVYALDKCGRGGGGGSEREIKKTGSQTYFSVKTGGQRTFAHYAAEGGHLDILRELEVRVGCPEYLGTNP